MSNNNIIMTVLTNLLYNAEGPTGNSWTIILPSDFQETVDEMWSSYIVDDHYEIAGNCIKISCG